MLLLPLFKTFLTWGDTDCYFWARIIKIVKNLFWQFYFSNIFVLVLFGYSVLFQDVSSSTFLPKNMITIPILYDIIVIFFFSPIILVFENACALLKFYWILSYIRQFILFDTQIQHLFLRTVQYFFEGSHLKLVV